MLIYLKLKMNWQAVLTSSSFHVVLTLEKSNIPQACLDTLCQMFIGCTTFPSFPWPTFQQCHWSPHHVDIYNSQIHGSQFRKQVISYCFILSKSPILMHDFSISLYQEVLFYFIQLLVPQFSIYVKFLSVYNHVLLKTSSHLRDCNRCDDWHFYIPCSYWPHVQLAHPAKRTLSPVFSWLILYTC